MRPLLRSILVVVIIFWGVTARGQQVVDSLRTGTVTGRLIVKGTRHPIADVQVALPSVRQLVNTDAEGRFSFYHVPYGTYHLVFGGGTVTDDTVRIMVSSAVADLKDLAVMISDVNASPQSLQIPTITLEENSLSTEEDGVKVSNISALLNAGRDPFLAATAFVFGPYRFRPRGYSNGQEVQINGNPMNDVETGDAHWAQWGGLNDVFRSKSNTYGLQPSGYAFGGLNGSVYFDAAASSQRKQTRITYSLTNRSYRNRLVFTQSSGLSRSGWAYSVSVSKRWAKEGYIAGTLYDGYSYYVGLSKQIGAKHELNLITFGAPTRKGKSAPLTSEAVDIAGSSRYNPNWGYQNGEKRNAKVADNFQPIAILNYEYKPSKSFRWATSFGYQTGKSKNSALDYFNGSNPRPDYYRYMPSYYALANTNPNDPNPGALAEFNDPDKQQIDWEGLYNANYGNYDSVLNANGIAGNTVKGRQSIYAVYNDVDEIRKYILNSNIEKVVNAHITIAGGAQYISQRTESYRQMSDLLGGDFYLNLNQFAFQQNVLRVSYNQYDLNIPDRIIKEGDKYSYDYISHFTDAHLWAQAMFTYSKLDFFVAARGGYNDYSREGLYRNGLFPDVSYGRSAIQRFTTYGVKGGFTVKLNGRHYLFANAGFGQDAPTMENTFIAPRVHNLSVPGVGVQNNLSLEAGYLMRNPKYNIRAVGYVTDIRNATEVKRYYNDDPAFKSFIDYVMQGIDTRFIGTELAADVKWTPSLSITAVASIGQAFYTNNPAYVGVYRDNDTIRTPVSRDVHVRNYYLGVGPQSAYTLGANYRSKQFWYAGLNFNYFDRNYIDISPDRRTPEAIAGVETGSGRYSDILDQQMLPSIFTIDISGGKSWMLSRYSKKLPRSAFVYLNVGISNLLDNRETRTGGFEQLRYDFADNNPDKFASKYFYGAGRNFFINLSLKF
jgi:hypothetical protein